MSGVRKACQGRPVTDADLAQLAQKVEETIRQSGASQVEANEIGLAILPFLRELDDIAYLRFASVYQGFASLSDFEQAIQHLKHDDIVPKYSDETVDGEPLDHSE
jgi:transcriptional repressor NrdR